MIRASISRLAAAWPSASSDRSTRAQARTSDEASTETHSVQAYLPASQPQAEEHPRLPRAHGHPWRPQGPLEPPQEGPQTPHGRDAQEVRSQRRLSLLHCFSGPAAQSEPTPGSTRKASRAARSHTIAPRGLVQTNPQGKQGHAETPWRGRSHSRVVWIPFAGSARPSWGIEQAIRELSPALSMLGFPQDPSKTWKTPEPPRCLILAAEVIFSSKGTGSSQQPAAFSANAAWAWTSGLEV